jgi:hypothetical protein
MIVIVVMMSIWIRRNLSVGISGAASFFLETGLKF